MVQSRSKYVLCFLDGVRILMCSKSSSIFLPAFPETKFLLKVVLYPGWYQSCQIACILFSWCTWHFTCVCCLCLLASVNTPSWRDRGRWSLTVSEPPHCSPRLCSLLFFKPPSRLQPEWPIWDANQIESLPQCCPQSWHQTLCQGYKGLHFQAPAYFSNHLSPYTAITLWDGAFFIWK